MAYADTRACSSSPREIYGDAQAPVLVRVGNGGAGPTGLLRALAEDYLAAHHVRAAIAWYQDISVQSIAQLAAGVIDIALVYERRQAREAIAAGVAQGDILIFHDHFVLAGPAANPAGVQHGDTVAQAFAKIAALGAATPKESRFLSRDDCSATNIREREVWHEAGLAPWTGAPWYLRRQWFPADALRYADRRGLYLLSDHGTWLSTRAALTGTAVLLQHAAGLSNPCRALLRPNPSAGAHAWLQYLTGTRGQRLIRNFGKPEHGVAFFSDAANADL